jgi:putative SOS response-associated peptidase YedK
MAWQPRDHYDTIAFMCGRFEISALDQILATFDAEETVELGPPRYNIAPSQQIPIVRQDDGQRNVTLARWGLIPDWANDASIGNKLINARGETAQSKPAFRDSFARRRCLIPATGFYEWKKSGTGKRPFHFGMKDGSLFAFAGLWSAWTSPAGTTVESCAILTTTANDLLKDMHDRMPVILPRESYEQWLAPAEASTHSKLLVPFDDSLMRRYEVSTLVNAPKNDSPDCIVPIDQVAASSSAASLLVTGAN